MAPPSPLSDVRAKDVAHFGQFISWTTLVAFVFGAVEALASLVFGEWPIGVAGGVTLGYGVCLLVARQLLRRGRLKVAVLTSCIGLLVGMVPAAIALPIAIPALMFLPLVVVALALPYIPGCEMRPLLIASWATGVIVAILSDRLPPSPELPAWFSTSFRLSSIGTALGLVLLLLWQFANRLNDALAQALATNADLRLAQETLKTKNEKLAAMTQQLWHTAKLATMGELAAGIAHELNNPLATISLRIETLLADLPANDSKRRALAIIAQEVERMGKLVSNLLQSSHRSEPQKSSVDVREEVEKTLELIHHQLHRRQIEAVKAFAPDVPLVLADQQQLRQVFLNLFTNASDAMPQGGNLTIRIGVPESQYPGVGRAPAQVFIEVADTGSGISPELLPRVWETFFTTKPEGQGTGLGLPICRRIVEEHGGTIDIQSTGIAGQGARVRLALPALKG